MSEHTDPFESLFAPWDASDWEGLVAHYPEAAETLRAIVAAGGTAGDIRREAEQRGYSSRVAAWLNHAALHVQRQVTVAPEAAGCADPERLE